MRVVCLAKQLAQLEQDISTFHEKYLQEKFYRFQAMDRITKMNDISNMAKKEKNFLSQ